MSQIAYSFIIPHRNCPDLLQRCIRSIPSREDIQIIVVDDNSGEGQKPYGLRSEVEVIFLSPEESCGAGHARNAGMAKAKGQWILFCDADDWYSENFLSVLDKYKSTKNDVIFFNFNIENGDRLKDSEYFRWRRVQQDIKEKNAQCVKFCFHVPWDKMVSRAFIDKYGISFEEVVLGNDIQFSLLVGYFSHHFQIIDEAVYNYYINNHSLSFGYRSVEKLMCVIEGWYKVNAFNDYIGLKGKNTNIPVQFAKMLFHNWKRSPRLLLKFIKELPHFIQVQSRYVKLIDVDEKD